MDYGSRHMPSNMYSILPVSHHHQQQQQFCANDHHRYASSYGTTGGVIVAASNSQAATAAVTVSSDAPGAKTSVTPAVVLDNSAITTAYAASQEHQDISYHRKVDPNSPQTSGAVTSMSPTDAYDASSSDSGFEEVITATSAGDEQQALKMVPSVVSNTEEVVYTAYQSGDCFKAY